MFWGLIMEPQRRYTQKVKKAFHISMAALDVSTSSEEPAQVMIGFEGRNYLLCTLKKPDMLQCSLDLNFEVGDEISLAANGKCHVHLTGYLIEDPNSFLDAEIEDEEEEEETKEIEIKKKNKKRNKNDIQNGPPVKKQKSDNAEDDSEDENSDIDVKALLEDTLESDDDDETFASDNDLIEEEMEEEEDDDDDEDEEEDESSLSEAESEEEEEDVKPKINGTPKREVPTPTKADKKKQQNKEEKSPQQKKSVQGKTLQGGLVIEDIKEGQGQPAKSGKFITVYYEGRLKSNNKMFDSTKQGAGFSFRLGGGEVIKGWDTGLVGMKVGGKRRITCPPNMAYGAKGSPPAIPANSTLVFEVELKKIR